MSIIDKLNKDVLEIMQSVIELKADKKNLEKELAQAKEENERLKKDYKNLMLQVSMLRSRLSDEEVNSVCDQWDNFCKENSNDE